jgi:nitroimidazol reductase NimA-like FMN-containing flavoprotein (pyridoxamine 5'-phosphate oxidase superfamily)
MQRRQAMEADMERRAIDLLNRHRLMTIATLRPDGWPQATMVGFVNDGTLIYFLISRTSQKFANIDRDQRVSITVGSDFDEPKQIKGLSIAAIASEITDPDQRDKAYKLLLERHPEFAIFPRPELKDAAFMRAAPKMITLIDYSKGFGHSDIITIGGQDVVAMQAARADNWGLRPAPAPLRQRVAEN